MATKGRKRMTPLKLKELQNESLRRYNRDLEEQVRKMSLELSRTRGERDESRRDLARLTGGEVHEVRTPPDVRAVSPVYMDAPTGVVAVAALRPGDRLLMVRKPPSPVRSSGCSCGGVGPGHVRVNEQGEAAENGRCLGALRFAGREA